jgi:hypothetical protein
MGQAGGECHCPDKREPCRQLAGQRQACKTYCDEENRTEPERGVEIHVSLI